MDVSTIYTSARLLASVDSTQAPDATLQTFLRRIYRDLANAIKTQVNEDFFYNEWTADTVASQREYTLPARTASVDGCNKVLGISVLPTTTATEYVKCTEMYIGALPQDLSRYSTEQSASEPFYVISDNSIFLYPTPSESVTGGLKIYGIADPFDPSTSGSESTVKIPLEHHDAIVDGIAYLIKKAERSQDTPAFQQDYEYAKRKMVTELSDRTTTPKESILPDLTVLG